MGDPRLGCQGQGRLGIVAFSRGERLEPWDQHCCASFLGNHFDLGPGGLQISVHLGGCWECFACSQELHGFRNAEAAFHAVKFWRSGRAGEFENLTGAQAAALSSEIAFGSTTEGFPYVFSIMLHVLRAKFARGSVLARALMATGSEFLLYHDARKGDDPLWSDDSDGCGRNWLGLQLMLIRDELQHPLDEVGEWTVFLEGCLDTHTGSARTFKGGKRWQDAVVAAAAAIRCLRSPVVPGHLSAGSAQPVLLDLCQKLVCRKSEQCPMQ